MKKTIIFLFIGSILAGAGLLAGVAYAFGSVAEAGVRQAAKTQTLEDGPVGWQFDLGNYQRGFFSSETHSKFHLDDAPVGEVEEAEDDGTPLRHMIYHGPLAMTPEGPKFCSYHIVTTMRRDKLGDEAREKFEKTYGTKEPFVINTTTGFGGDQSTRIDVTPFEEETELGGTMKFDGASGTIETGPDLAYARGEYKIGAFTGNDFPVPGAEIEVTPSSGTLDYTKGKKLIAKFKSGEMTANTVDSLFTMAPTEGEIDWLKSQHLEAKVTIGTLEAGGRNGEGTVIAGPGTISMDYQRVSDKFAMLMGETKLHLEKVELDMPGQRMAMKDFVLRADSGEERGKLYGLINYEVGEVDAPEDPDSPLPFSQIAGKGMEIELGIQGFDLAAIESLSDKSKELTGLAGIGSFSGLGDPAASNKLAEALAENSEAVTEISRGMMDLVQPGLEIYYKTRLRGAEGISLADIRIGMGGDKKLVELKTTREMLESLKGSAVVKVNKKQYPPEEIQELLGESAETFIADHLDRLEMIAELEGGKLFVNGEATPLLDDLSPSFDEPFDWDGFIEGMAAGLAAGAAAAEPDIPMEE